MRKPWTKEQREKHSLMIKEEYRLGKRKAVVNSGCFKKGVSSWCAGTKGIMKPNSGTIKKGDKGESCPSWKGGISSTKEYRTNYNRRYRNQKKNGGDLPVKIIQLVYEDNIKKYGTLTCYLCLKPIRFRFDNLEHKTPLSRGGTNEYNNLEVSCIKCNVGKGTKTLKEYKKWLEDKLCAAKYPRIDK